MNDEEPTVPDSNLSEDSDEFESLRPNRWQGAPSTWTTLTAQERGLAASLDQIRNADLSIHLFNAHALKRRAREFEDNPEEVRKEHPAVPDDDQTFRPPKTWTAWPLPPDEVPVEGESIGPEDPDEKYTFKRREPQRPSRGLVDVLLGLTLKLAKERFMGREEEDDDTKVEFSAENTLYQEDDEATRRANSEEASDGSAEVLVKGGSEPPLVELLRPVVSTDDDRSREIICPSIRHTLAKLDEVLMALHHARKTCRRCSYSSATSATSDAEADTENEGSASPKKRKKRPQGRPRKFSDLPHRSRPQSIPPEDEDDSSLFRGKTTHLGRPLTVYERLDGESQQEYLVRIARLQKRALPPFAPPPETKPEKSPTPSPEKSRKYPGDRATSEERAARRGKRLNPRDWSEVLSSAALIGFPPDVIARATQRCANLFGEGMIMRTMVETPFMEKVPDTVTRYVPEEIPNLDDAVLVSSSDDGNSSEDSGSGPQIKRERPDPRELRRARIPPSKQVCFCPMPDCPRRIQGFRDNAALRRHIELGHKIAKDEVDDYILPSDEEMDGAVHIDGFLKPLKRLGGARGSYRKVAKRARVEESSDGEEEVEKEGVEELEAQSRNPATAIRKQKATGDSSDDRYSSSSDS